MPLIVKIKYFSLKDLGKSRDLCDFGIDKVSKRVFIILIKLLFYKRNLEGWF